MSFTRERPELERPIESFDDLLSLFRSGEKPPEAWRVGTEHEKLCLQRDSLEPVPYEGPRGFGVLFGKLVREHGFSPLQQGEQILAVERDGTSLTLEPGGQFELAGAPLRTLHETCREFRDHVALVKYAAAELGIVFVGLGMQPLARLEQVPRMPHERYAFMRRYLAERGSGGLYMMHATAGVQASYDYASGSDLARKMRVALAASPIVTALYANSSITEGKPNGFETRRAAVWRDTDPDRCGLLPFAFEDAWLKGDPYRTYADWALDAPMFFVRRNGKHLSMQGRSFRQFLERGSREFPATLADWDLHLTTLFPEVRLKRVIEVRGADAVPAELVCALPAFWKGLFYDEPTLEAALSRLRHWTHPDADRMHEEAARKGLALATPDGPALAVARELVELAATGLRRLAERNSAGEDETIHLDPLREVLERGKSPARHALELWDGPWQGRVAALVEYAAY